MNIGGTIRAIRKNKKMTIRAVSELSGIAQSLISQIENDKANPALSTLIAIAEALDVEIMSFFGKEEPAESPVVKPEDRALINERCGTRFFSLTNNVIGNIEFLYCVYSKDGMSNDRIYTHEGVEALLLIHGKLEIEVDGLKHILNPGDSISFSSDKPHLTRNIHDGESIAVTVNTPPTF